MMMDEFVEEQGRSSSVASIVDFSGDQSCFASRLLGDAMMREGESWPSRDGRFFTPILNLYLPELPVLPAPLQPYRWLALYIDVDSLVVGESPHGTNWELRLYEDLHGLKEHPIPQVQQRAKSWTAKLLKWHSHRDILDYYAQI